MKPLILKEHFKGNDTIIYDGYIMNSCQFWNAKDPSTNQQILSEYYVSQEEWFEVLKAVQTQQGNTFLFNYYS